MIEDRPFSADQNVFVGRGPDRIGSRYLKCLYRGYTDARTASPGCVVAPVPSSYAAAPSFAFV